MIDGCSLNRIAHAGTADGNRLPWLKMNAQSLLLRPPRIYLQHSLLRRVQPKPCSFDAHDGSRVNVSLRSRNGSRSSFEFAGR